MEEILTALDLRGVRDLPGEMGAFSVESLFVRYDFSFDELVGAFRALPDAQELPEPLKTMVHETTHLFHTITTPFGFLIYALRRLQASVVIDAINSLRFAHKMKVRYPLVDFIFQMPPKVQQDVGPYLKVWYECELFILLALDGPEAWGRQAVENPLVRGLGPSELFSRIQRYLAIFYREQIRKLRAAGGGGGEANAPLPFADYEPDEPGLGGSGKDDRNVIAIQMMVGEANMIAITESAASVAEFWRNTRLNREQFFQQVQSRWQQQGLALASGFLRGAINARRAEEYVLSYLALCDVALFGPVLPHHRHFRKGANILYQVLPFFRIRDLLGAAHEIRAMESLGDYVRYTSELCRALGWVAPAEITQFTAKEHVALETDNLELAYLISSHYRKSKPWIFQDYSFLLAGDNKQFWMDINFPVIQYGDRTVYHSNKALLVPLTRFYLVRAALRAILLRDNVSLKLPYRPKNAEEVSFLRETLIQDLESAIGLRINDLSLN